MPPSTKSLKPSSRKLSTLAPQPFELRSSLIQGRGAFATRFIRKGARIIEYVGERITQAQADERYDDTAMDRHHTFLFNVDEDTVIDAAHEGNDARFINHSCDPNCQAFLEGDRVYIYSRRDIQEGEELAYDYGYERTEDMGPEEEALYICRCGASTCRGTILAPVNSEPEPKKVVKKAKRTTKKAAKETARKAKKTSSATKKGPAKSGRSGSKVGSRSRSARG